ncbi:MAG: CocE/NonD family hydrolase [Mycobacterium sp.]
MTAGRFVGRVGGLAVALGVGAVVYGGGATASADTAVSDSGAGSAQSPGAAHAKRGPARPARAGTAAAPRSTARAKSPAAGPPSAAGVVTVAQPAAAQPGSARLAAAAAPSLSDPRPRPPLAAARKQPLSGSLKAAGGVTVNPTVEWGGTIGPDPARGVPVATALPGVLVGTVNATSASGLPLAYVGVGRPNAGGKIGGGPLLPLSNFYSPDGGFSYIPDAATLTTPGAAEQFRVMAMELSKFDQRIIKVLGPLGGLLVPQALAVIHRIPVVNTLASPLIGRATVAEFTVTPNALAEDRPTAFTYKMPSFDGTLISLNYFPATNVSTGAVDNAPTVLAASGLACAANTDPLTRYGQLFISQQFGSLTPGIAPLRDDRFQSFVLDPQTYDGGGGYNVVTWDPRGEFASGGQLNIDNPMLEGRDVSSMISWLTGSTNPAAGQVSAVDGDPRVGMTGGSYGGGIQLTTVDPRIDAITPEIGWNSLISSLYPGDGNTAAFKTGWGAILVAALAVTGARVNPSIYQGIFTGAVFGFLSPSSQAVLSSVGPTVLLTEQQAPTLQFQGIDDTLFPLSESVAAGKTISANGISPDYRLFWFCGGHGTCDIAEKPAEQDAQGVIQNLRWLDQYVAGNVDQPADVIPRFQWYDQNGLYWSSDKLPWDPAFNQGSYAPAAGKGGFLPLWPVLGGSGPYPIRDLPFSIVNAGPARNAVNLELTPPVGKQVVGSPTLSFTYSGLGTGHTVYAQLVDQTTRLVLSNIVTPIQVTLNGREQTVTVPLEDIVYTVEEGDSLQLQITSSAVNYENFWSYGWINISDINVELPLHTPGT